MAFANDIANDYTFFDDAETGTLSVVRPDGSKDFTVTATNSVKGTRYQDSMGGGATGRRRTWSIPAVQVTGETVEPGDKLTVGSGATLEVWEVVSASLATLNTRWLCECCLQE